MSRPIDAVLLIAFGGPTSPEEIHPFLLNVTRGHRIPAGRLEEVARHYERIGGRSPLNELTFRQAHALQGLLRRNGPDFPVYVGMRNWTPYLHETLTEMAEKGIRRALGLILSSLETEASWGRYQADVVEARARVGALAPEVAYAPPWYDQEGFIEAIADHAQQALETIPASEREDALLVFTAHSIPVAMAQGSPYLSQFREVSRRVAARLGYRRWTLAYQSRSGDPREPWLEPDVLDLIRAQARQGIRQIVVAPVGFVSDHVEILYDLDIEAHQVARAAGINFTRARAVNDHPSFIRMLRDLVMRAASA